VASLAVVSLPLGWSYAHALLRPGGSIGVRTVEWIRSIGGGRLVAPRDAHDTAPQR
jgi:hypothetical protein